MIVKIPYDKDNLSIKRHYKVLEIGPGDDPVYRANVLVDNNPVENYHRSGELKFFKHQSLIVSNVEKLPFKDKEFDYVICSHVLEHVDNPGLALEELFRVAKMGYIEVPSFISELQSSKVSHKWVVLMVDGKMVFYSKSKVPFPFGDMYGQLFTSYLPYKSLPFRLFSMYRNNAQNVKAEWISRLDYIIDPEDFKYNRYFLNRWDSDMISNVFPPASRIKEFFQTLKAIVYFVYSRLKHLVFIRDKAIPYSHTLKSR